MLDRFNPSDLIQGLASGLRKRRHLHDEDSEEKADWSSRIILVGLPAAVAVLICVFRWEFTGADQILAGAALLCGSLLAAFAQIASWRERALARNRRVEDLDVRALNEATAHVLVSLMVSTGTVVATFVLANLKLDEDSSDTLRNVAVGASAVSGATFLYIGLSIIIVANLLWDAYNNEERNARREAKKRN